VQNPPKEYTLVLSEAEYIKLVDLLYDTVNYSKSTLISEFAERILTLPLTE